MEVKVTGSYAHTQVGYFLIVAYALVVVALGVLAATTSLRPFAVVGLVAIAVALALFCKLRITLDEHFLELRFGVGLFRKRIRIDEVVACRVVRNPWYYGWGIRYTPRGWSYSVSGLSAVELDLRNGRHCRVGTDAPEALSQALGRLCAR